MEEYVLDIHAEGEKEEEDVIYIYNLYSPTSCSRQDLFCKKTPVLSARSTKCVSAEKSSTIQ